ncbi:Rhodanese domain protein UPF0176 [Methylophaga frappieri]|uniref:tRNA uridine(34) hydroxylase n=1 Tax=Methylophaga frappieri (strain ATCC BAA-2434 / DSM 25690 / JAM7) TaxID=754477 RepID=I1YFW9_METFJ|nr:rhodanese-related sulfurtransferase [Methylophaga frappieri]AFJ01812.1 Rhodanese domain protein UPF0176 [Methylophaga frappieri]
MPKIVVCALYKFVALPDYANLRAPILELMLDEQIRGTLLLAHEGINGTVAGSRHAIDKLLVHLNADPRLAPISVKESLTDTPPFLRSRVKLKREIVTMGVDGIDPRRSVGTYVKPADWNALINDPDVVLIDTRNDYEYQVGTFKNAINPNTDSFREFPDYVKNHLNPEKHKKVAMFCTGGIRCEKSTAFLKEQGFEAVYHLEGGILKYLEEVPETESMWQGECFVFDERVTVNHQLEKGDYDQCHACRMPITEAEKTRPEYQHGISCHHCYDKTSDHQKSRFAERHQQMRLARLRGETHMGADTSHTIRQNRQAKRQKRLRDQQQNNKNV